MLPKTKHVQRDSDCHRQGAQRRVAHWWLIFSPTPSSSNNAGCHFFTFKSSFLAAFPPLRLGDRIRRVDNQELELQVDAAPLRDLREQCSAAQVPKALCEAFRRESLTRPDEGCVLYPLWSVLLHQGQNGEAGDILWVDVDGVVQRGLTIVILPNRSYFEMCDECALS